MINNNMLRIIFCERPV